MVVTWQDHHQGLLYEKTERQPRHALLPSKKSGVDFSFRKSLRKQRGVLTRYHHVDVGQLVAQDPQGFGHPGQFVPGQKAHREAGLGRMNSPPRSFGSRVNLQENSTCMMEKGSTRRCQLDSTRCARY